MKRRISLAVFIFFLFIGNAFSQTVYITNSGKKYHNENCRYLNSSSTPIDLSDAASKGFSPYKVCKPSKLDNITTENEFQEKVQCSETTKKGTRCKRMTKNSNGKCWQHGGN